MLKSLSITLLLLLGCNPVLAGEPVEVGLLHWWVSPGEQGNLAVMRQSLAVRGMNLQAKGVADNDKIAYRKELKRLVQIGQPPMASQVIGYDVQYWAERGQLVVLDELARREQWGEVVPYAVQQLSKYQGHWVAVPMNLHSTNWIWLNNALMQRLGLRPPDTWDDLLVMLNAAQAAGIKPLAMGDAAAQHMPLFEAVAAGAGGAEFYRRVFIELDTSALDDALLLRIFQRMRALRGYLGVELSALSWDQSTAQIRQGQALMQIQGSWVGTEMTHHGLVPGRDYECARFPDTQGLVLFNSDQVVLLNEHATDSVTRDRLASALMSVELQRDTNIMTGAAPARVDIATTAFNQCGRQAIEDVRAANMRRTLLESVTMSNASRDAALQGLFTIVSEHFTGQTSDAEAVVRLREVITQAAAPKL